MRACSSACWLTDQNADHRGRATVRRHPTMPIRSCERDLLPVSTGPALHDDERPSQLGSADFLVASSNLSRTCTAVLSRTDGFLHLRASRVLQVCGAAGRETAHGRIRGVDAGRSVLPNASLSEFRKESRPAPKYRPRCRRRRPPVERAGPDMIDRAGARNAGKRPKRTEKRPNATDGEIAPMGFIVPSRPCPGRSRLGPAAWQPWPRGVT